MRLGMRFDMRAPDIGAPATALYPAAVEQAAWADRLGFHTVYLAEHHGADDGYCPSPIVLGAAIAGRTTGIEIHLSALVVTLHDPIRLAEDLAVLDLLSRGRLSITAGMGYRPHEFGLFGLEQGDRVNRLNQALRVLQQAWTGEPFEHLDQTVAIRPIPSRRPRPRLYLGGSTIVSARRAARLGAEGFVDGYRPATPALNADYSAARQELGLDVPPPGPRPVPTFLYVTDDPEAAWVKVAPHLLYTTNSYARWAQERGDGVAKYSAADSITEIKANESFRVLTPDECIAFARGLSPDNELRFHPLMGGLDPEVAWSSLELFEAKVYPVLVAEGLVAPRPEPASGGR